LLVISPPRLCEKLKLIDSCIQRRF